MQAVLSHNMMMKHPDNFGRGVKSGFNVRRFFIILFLKLSLKTARCWTSRKTIVKIQYNGCKREDFFVEGKKRRWKNEFPTPF
jgi:hypothetical protein